MDEKIGAAVTGQLTEGQTLGDYEIVSMTGSGGMGVVYKARQRSLGRIVALKVIREDIARVAEYRDRFLREARLAASVDHPHIVSVYDVGEDSCQLYLAMQWIEGEDLKHHLARTGRLPSDQAVRIASQLAGALDAVHSVGLVHRDVKPANVLVRQIGGQAHAYLSDFGVAKPSQAVDDLTRTGWIVGTAGYLSPEQIRGAEVGASSDLYALACLFYEALTGQPPFTAENEMALRWAHANDARPTASAVIPALARYDRFLDTALAIDPGRRFGSGQEFAAALTAAESGQTAPTVSQPPAEQPHAATTIGPPTPVPPPHTPPPAYPQAALAYSYATPPPQPQQRSGSPLALIVLGLVAIAGIAAGVLAVAGVFSHNTPTSSLPGTRPKPLNTPTRAAKAAHPHARPQPPARTSTTASPPPTQSGTTSCGGDLSVGPNTSCGFAKNVESAYDHTSGGNQVVTANSPATGLTYTIECTGSTPHTCTGGTTHNAAVYFNSGPGSTAGTPSGIPAGASPCGGGIYVGANTSCGFAQNVEQAYHNSSGGDTNVTAYSPATGETYTIHCTALSPHVCTGGTTHNASVYFP
jgi:serine/threonine protein kinase